MLLSSAAAIFVFLKGFTLYYGDAEAHLNIARRLLDNRALSGEELGTVWLPLPHILMAPFAASNAMWRSGLAGVFAAAACFVIAVGFFFLAAKRVNHSNVAGWTAALIFALNPNMLHLQSTPMTESVFAACLAVLLWATLEYRHKISWSPLLIAAAASNAASLTRYEGWFLIPFLLLFVLAERNWKHTLAFSVLASLSPLAWLAHNQFYYSNALEFYNGQYSAMAIAREGLKHGVTRYPGNNNWPEAIHYFFAAAHLTQGTPLVLVAVAGLFLMLLRKNWWPLLLLALPPLFYVISIHSASTPIYVPGLWPYTWYNTRYGLAALPLAAFAAAALVGKGKIRAVLICGLVTVPWFFTVIPCWKESQVNSVARRAWTGEAAHYLANRYNGGDFIYTFGDLSGILREAGVPLSRSLHQDNHPGWDAAVQRPDLFLKQEWVLALSGDRLSKAFQNTTGRYRLAKRVMVEGAPAVEIYRRAEAGQVPPGNPTPVP